MGKSDFLGAPIFFMVVIVRIRQFFYYYYFLIRGRVVFIPSQNFRNTPLEP
jgi:hypothetical protein